MAGVVSERAKSAGLVGRSQNVNHTKEFDLESNNDREPIQGFKKETFMIRFFF